MKLFVLNLIFAGVAGFELRGVQHAAEPVDGWGFSGFRAPPARDEGPVERVRLSENLTTAVQDAGAKQDPLAAVAGAVADAGEAVTAATGSDSPAAAATTDDILAEVKHRVEVCGASGSPLAGLSLDDLFAELKKREAAKVCDAPAAASPAVAVSPADAPAGPAEAPAPAPPPTTTTTTSTVACPDNFMDEIVDQANPEFDRFDTNKDGCLEDNELTAHLKKQIEMARHRDYYWIRRNITDAARDLIRSGKQTHAAVDENDSGCLNKEELDIIHHAICDCPTQFMFMDHNADGKISQSEAANFVSEQMVHADINYVTMKKIFRAADVNGNKFLSQTEFCEAGSKYQGDGPEGNIKPWAPAPAPGPGPAPAF